VGPDDDQPERHSLEMQRGASQLLFNYLPGRTVDWEDGLAIVQLGSPRLSAVWEDERATALFNEIGQLLDYWREAGGTLDPQFPDPRREHGRFAVGSPVAIEAMVLETALVCQRCSRLYFPKRSQLTSTSVGVEPTTCPSCGRRSLRQYGFVFVHGCGEMIPITEWIPAMRPLDNGSFEPTRHPIRCAQCGTRGQPALPARSERVKDMKIICLNCNAVIVDRLTARCGRCLQQINSRRHHTGEREFATIQTEPAHQQGDTIVTRVAMRVSRYNASDTYYPQTVSMLRFDRPTYTTVGEPELDQLYSMLPIDRRPHVDRGIGDTLVALAKRLQAVEAIGRQDEAAQLKTLIAQAAQGSTVTASPIDNSPSDDLIPPPVI
jgi:hypothetical protein